MLKNATFALLAMTIVIVWQWTTVTVNYQGNWSALFCTGALRGVPETLAAENIYQFQNSTGYDGQFYHYIAHDPLLRNPEIKSFVDEPRLRYRRILAPGLAWLLAFGKPEWIDRVYLLVCLASAGVGVFWSSRLCLGLGRPAGCGLLFLIFPAVIVSVDRLVADVTLAALTVGFALHWKRRSWGLWLILAAAALTRETGSYLAAGYCGYLLLQRQWIAAAGFSLAGLPALLWYGYVHAHTAPFDYMASFVPLSAILAALTHPAAYSSKVPLVTVLRAGDLLAILGILLAFALALHLAIASRCFEPECLAGLCFALTGILLQRADHWVHVFDFGRVYTPLLVILAVQALSRNSFLWLVPWIMIVPRVLMQLAPQFVKV